MIQADSETLRLLGLEAAPLKPLGLLMTVSHDVVEAPHLILLIALKYSEFGFKSFDPLLQILVVLPDPVKSFLVNDLVLEAHQVWVLKIRMTVPEYPPIFVLLDFDPAQQPHRRIQIKLLVRDLLLEADLVDAVLDLLLHQGNYNLHLVLDSDFALLQEILGLNKPILKYSVPLTYFLQGHRRNL